MEKDSAALLKLLGDMRDALLERVIQVLQADARVTAAWLTGSFGRGEADEWSDLDLHVTVEDAALPVILDEHQTLFARCGRPIFVTGNFPSDSMPGGRFWLVQYAPYMLEIDWNIGPTQAAYRPEAAYLLFDRVGIPTTPPVAPIDEEQRRRVADKQLSFFWAMAPIAIKFAGRGHTRLAVKQVGYLEGALIQLWYALYRPERLQKDEYHQNRPLVPELDARLPRFGPSITPMDALAVIRAFCREMETLHPAAAALGATIPDEVIRETASLANLTEIIAKTGGSAPTHGSRR